jgi:predicted amidohydrolase
VGAAGLLLLGTVLWGQTALREPRPTTFAAAAVQPNLDTHPQFGSATPARDVAVLQRLTAEAARVGAMLVVWPETASPVDLLGKGGALGTIASWARRYHVSVIATSLEGGRTNSAFAVAPSGSLMGRYDKVRLVPFVETGEESSLAPAPLAAPPARIGVAICFESIFPGLARRSVRQGADLLAVLTNDAWFDGQSAPAQHAALVPFRAIEERRYLVRAANQGISAIFDPHGRPLGRLSLGARGVVVARVAPVHGLTPYARVGDLFGWTATLAAASLVLPRAMAFLGEEATTPAFARLLTNSALPLVIVTAGARLSTLSGAGIGRGVVPIALVALLGVVVFLSAGRSRAELGLRLGGFVPAAAIGSGFLGALVLVVHYAFATHGANLDLVAPRGGWWLGTVVQVVIVGLALEWWLRGLVFADAVAWRGWGLAVVWSALLGTVAVASRGAEAMTWALFSGTALGLIRARWTQVPALAVVHGVGNVLLGFLIPSF